MHESMHVHGGSVDRQMHSHQGCAETKYITAETTDFQTGMGEENSLSFAMLQSPSARCLSQDRLMSCI